MTDLVTIPPDLQADVPTVVAWARGLQITTAEALQDAGLRLVQIKQMAKRWTDMLTLAKRKADESKKALLDLEKTISVPLAEAERLAKTAIGRYQSEQEALRAAEQRRLQAEVDAAAARERQKSMFEAERQRQIEAEARAKAQRATQEAEAAATAAERKRLLAQAATASRKAEAAVIKQEAAVEEAAAVVAPVVRVESVAAKIPGVTTRTTWRAEVVDLAAFLAAVFEQHASEMVLPNLKYLDAIAKSLKEQARFSGVQFYVEETLAVGGR